MIRLYYLFFLFGLVACRQSNNSNQFEKVVIVESDYDFGIVPDSIQILHHRFQIKNNTSDTCYISKIEKSCGCTRVRVSNMNIAPFSHSYIDVEVDLGTNYNFFERDINIYTDFQDDPLTVYVRASRKMPKHIITHQFPVKVSQNLRLNAPYLILGNVSLGESKSSFINLYNSGADQITFSANMIDAPSYISLLYENSIPPNEYGKIIVTADLSEVKDIWGLQNYTMLIKTDKANLRIPIQAIFVEKPKKDEKPRMLIPIPHYTIDISKDSIVNYIVRNIGKTDLFIRDVKTLGKVKQIIPPKNRIHPNKQDTLSVLLEKKQKEKIVIGISSNDPIEPYKEISIICK